VKLSSQSEPRKFESGRVIANAKRANASYEYVAVTSIPIADQIAGICSQPQAAVSWLAIHSAVGCAAL
jgi:hypothetical protein